MCQWRVQFLQWGTIAWICYSSTLMQQILLGTGRPSESLYSGLFLATCRWWFAPHQTYSCVPSSWQMACDLSKYLNKSSLPTTSLRLMGYSWTQEERLHESFKDLVHQWRTRHQESSTSMYFRCQTETAANLYATYTFACEDILLRPLNRSCWHTREKRVQYWGIGKSLHRWNVVLTCEIGCYVSATMQDERQAGQSFCLLSIRDMALAQVERIWIIRKTTVGIILKVRNDFQVPC